MKESRGGAEALRISETRRTDENAGYAITDKGPNFTRHLYRTPGQDCPFVHAHIARSIELELNQAVALLSEILEKGYIKPKHTADETGLDERVEEFLRVSAPRREAGKERA